MAGEAHLKVATSSIRRAIMDKQQEVRDLQTHISQLHSDIDKEISNITTVKHQTEVLAAKPDLDDRSRAEVLRSIHDHDKGINEKHRQRQELEGRINHEISDKQRIINELQQLVSSFERQWGV